MLSSSVFCFGDRVFRFGKERPLSAPGVGERTIMAGAVAIDIDRGDGNLHRRAETNGTVGKHADLVVVSIPADSHEARQELAGDASQSGLRIPDAHTCQEAELQTRPQIAEAAAKRNPSAERRIFSYTQKQAARLICSP